MIPDDICAQVDIPPYLSPILSISILPLYHMTFLKKNTHQLWTISIFLTSIFIDIFFIWNENRHCFESNTTFKKRIKEANSDKNNKYLKLNHNIEYIYHV